MLFLEELNETLCGNTMFHSVGVRVRSWMVGMFSKVCCKAGQLVTSGTTGASLRIVHQTFPVT